MKRTVKHTAWTLMLLAATLTVNAYASSRSAGAGDPSVTSKAAKKKTAKAKRVSQIKFLSGSGETARERSTRLKRECKGRVNAGACEGYTN